MLSTQTQTTVCKNREPKLGHVLSELINHCIINGCDTFHATVIRKTNVVLW